MWVWRLDRFAVVVESYPPYVLYSHTCLSLDILLFSIQLWPPIFIISSSARGMQLYKAICVFLLLPQMPQFFQLLQINLIPPLKDNMTTSIPATSPINTQNKSSQHPHPPIFIHIPILVYPYNSHPLHIAVHLRQYLLTRCHLTLSLPLDQLR